MTTPAKYCCTLQQSKRLRELGVMSESLYYIIQGDDSQEQTIFTKSELIQLLKDSAVDQYMSEQPSGYPEIYPAYSVGELGEMLKEYDNWHQHTQGSLPRYYNDGVIWYWGVQDTAIAWGNNEAQSRAFLLIHLLENNLITSEQVNNQLK